MKARKSTFLGSKWHALLAEVKTKVQIKSVQHFHKSFDFAEEAFDFLLVILLKDHVLFKIFPQILKPQQDNHTRCSFFQNRYNLLKWILKVGKWQIGMGFLGPFLSPPSDGAWKGGWQGGGVIQTTAPCNRWPKNILQPFFLVTEFYPHALHSRHGPEGPEGPQGSHCPEGLNPSSAKQRGSEVDERDLGLLVG